MQLEVKRDPTAPVRSSFFDCAGVGRARRWASVTRHLYVHIPFCPKICPYCSFYKEASDRNKTQRFLDAVLLELDSRIARLPLQPETIFFGGGTPSALSTKQLEYLLGGIRDRVDCSEVAEWTLEMNPATVSLEKATVLRGLGVNRISMGVQSWDPALLRTLGRVHTAEQAERSYAILREAGFENVNLDLMFGVPGQGREQWMETLARTVALDPDHVSAYSLTYEEDTEFFTRLMSKEFSYDSVLDARLFDETMGFLEAAGYRQYEISNYAKPGFECRHNLAYWLGADYLGLGPSAFSTRAGTRWRNVADTARYISCIESGDDPADFQETITLEIATTEKIAFGLRTDIGVDTSLLSSWPDQVAEMTAGGFLERRKDRLVLTRSGRMVADAIAANFIP
jgi:oxygen-independent coproporphyrinogen-3 oxidase